jgi:hypothetical protein
MNAQFIAVDVWGFMTLLNAAFGQRNRVGAPFPDIAHPARPSPVKSTRE